MEVVFYTTNCPKCHVLEAKLKQKNINYITNTDIDEMEALGLMSAPALKIGDKVLPFGEANKWINEQ